VCDSRIAQADPERPAGERDLEDEERGGDGEDLCHGQVQLALHGKQRQQGLGDLIEAGRAAARRHAEAALDETGERIARHRHGADERAGRRRDVDRQRRKGGGDNGDGDAADRLARPQQRPTVDEVQAEIERRRPSIAEEPPGDDRRAVRHAQKQQQPQAEPGCVHRAERAIRVSCVRLPNLAAGRNAGARPRRRLEAAAALMVKTNTRLV
jgi:hypothetical protein